MDPPRRPVRDRGSPDKPLLDRLGVRVGARVALVGVDDEGFRGRLRERTDDLSEASPRPGCDLVFFRAHDPPDLERLAQLRSLLRDSGAIWVLREKGANRRITDIQVIEAARAAGLVDNKIASFSETLAAMRLVIPLAMRGRGEPPAPG